MAVVMAGASFCLPLPVRASGALFLASSPTVAVSFGFSRVGLSSRRADARRSGQQRSLSIHARVQEVDLSKVVPQADRVLVRLEELPNKSAGGVLLPKSVTKFENYLVGEVISIGKEATSIEKGQKVLFSDINAYEVNLGTPEKLCFCCISDLLAIVE
ncbi:unnamed protein product [Sphagnum compactum]